MKQFFLLFFLTLNISLFSQEKNTIVRPANSISTQSSTSEQKKEEVELQKPAAAVQYRGTSAVLPYDVNDKYMGRAKEFLGNLTVSELPSDFPVYEKQWNLKEYNQVVTAFYFNHLNIVNEKVKEKLALLQH